MMVGVDRLISHINMEYHIVIVIIFGIWHKWSYLPGLLQERRNSIANALELRLPCNNPSISSWLASGVQLREELRPWWHCRRWLRHGIHWNENHMSLWRNLLVALKVVKMQSVQSVTNMSSKWHFGFKASGNPGTRCYFYHETWSLATKNVL